MNRLILAAVMAIGVAGLGAAPAAARNYDCTKAGNATKAECTTGAKPAKAAAAKAAKAAASPMKAAPAKAATTKTATTKTATAVKTERNYDCRLAGNKNKAACKTAAAPAAKPMVAAPAAKPMVAAAKPMARPAPAAKPATATPGTRTYDCAKAGNANKTVCKTAAAAKPKAASTASDDKNPAGSIGRCKDGFYSHSKQRTGACSRHGGVAKWS